MLVHAIQKEFQKALKRKWDKIYVFVDFHEIIIKPDFNKESGIVDYYPYAKELLQYLTIRKDICLVTWTCSHPEQIKNYQKQFIKDGIKFDYIQKNPEVVTGQMYGNYDIKPYYNIMIDDKAGVVPSELKSIYEEFKKWRLF